MYEAYQVLGLEEGCEHLEVKRAYLRLKELYSHDSLAIYTLLTDDEKLERLELIEAAYKKIVEISRPQTGVTLARVVEQSKFTYIPDPEQATGAYLRWVREQAGLSIRQLADRTKIGSVTLEDIEAERFDHLPPVVYLRGFLREFSRSLGLVNASELSEFFLKRIPPRVEE